MNASKVKLIKRVCKLCWKTAMYIRWLLESNAASSCPFSGFDGCFVGYIDGCLWIFSAFEAQGMR